MLKNKNVYLFASNHNKEYVWTKNAQRKICTRSSGGLSFRSNNETMHKLLPGNKSWIKLEFQDYKQEQEQEVMNLSNLEI